VSLRIALLNEVGQMAPGAHIFKPYFDRIFSSPIFVLATASIFPSTNVPETV
jgi:hypothetical protein